jgi:hypothetical protein
MKKENLIWLTKEIYRLTLFFPKKEPLRYKMRELADDILADLVRLGDFEGEAPKNLSKGRQEIEYQLLENLDVIDSFFSVALEQNWVKTPLLLVIHREYANLKEELERKELKLNLNLKSEAPILLGSENRIRVEPAQAPQRFSGFVERHERIMTFLRENGRAQVWQVKQIMPDISKRTLRRDFEHLVKEGIIERIGERNDTFYQIKINQS